MKNKAAFLILSLLPFSGTAAWAAETETAIFAGGCFWCVESDFESVAGVTEATSGYIGGSAKTANYKQIGKGGTGHYEAVKIEYDPAVVSYGKLVDIFWRSIDPLDAGGQFCDRGDSYRSAIFSLNKAQHKTAQSIKKAIDDSGRLSASIATEILPASTFYPAEEYHQNYYKNYIQL